MKTCEVLFPSGELQLEGVLAVPEGPGPFPAVVICHPHPLYGGDMDNNVVVAIAEALVRAGFAAFRFNFRGVGRSEGEHANGVGEQADVSAAIDFIVVQKAVDPGRTGLAGYSAGARYAYPVFVKDERVKAFAAVSPALSMGDFSPLKSCPKPKLLISGSRDDFTPAHIFCQFCRGVAEPVECQSIEGADHFWSGREAAAADKVRDFFTGVLVSGK